MYLLPLWLLIFSFFVAISLGRLIGISGVLYTAISCLLLCVLSSIYMFFEVCISGVYCTMHLFDWLCVDVVDIHCVLLYDQLSVSMLVIINVISLCAHLYAVKYMAADAHFVRFMSCLSLFTFFMLVLVLSDTDNVLQLFVCLYGVCICSYLLINFLFTLGQSSKLCTVYSYRSGRCNRIAYMRAIGSSTRTNMLDILKKCFLPLIFSLLLLFFGLSMLSYNGECTHLVHAWDVYLDECIYIYSDIDIDAWHVEFGVHSEQAKPVLKPVVVPEPEPELEPEPEPKPVCDSSVKPKETDGDGDGVAGSSFILYICIAIGAYVLFSYMWDGVSIFFGSEDPLMDLLDNKEVDTYTDDQLNKLIELVKNNSGVINKGLSIVYEAKNALEDNNITLSNGHTHSLDKIRAVFGKYADNMTFGNALNILKSNGPNEWDNFYKLCKVLCDYLWKNFNK